MAVPLPALRRLEFERRLQELSPERLSRRALDALWAHYSELRRWSVRLSLIGPGTAEDVLARHYGESLAALPLLDPGAGQLLDLGSGAGFPGFVLAAACDRLRVTLVEARQRKWAFLEAAARRAVLPLTCLNARVEHPLAADLPAEFDVLTLRALKLPPRALQTVAQRLRPGGQILAWVGAEGRPELPGFFVRRTVALGGSRRRQILDLRQQEEPNR